eukprot:2314510-Amphidinium_carterae.1
MSSGTIYFSCKRSTSTALPVNGAAAIQVSCLSSMSCNTTDIDRCGDHALLLPVSGGRSASDAGSLRASWVVGAALALSSMKGYGAAPWSPSCS